MKKNYTYLLICIFIFGCNSSSSNGLLMIIDVYREQYMESGLTVIYSEKESKIILKPNGAANQLRVEIPPPPPDIEIDSNIYFYKMKINLHEIHLSSTENYKLSLFINNMTKNDFKDSLYILRTHNSFLANISVINHKLGNANFWLINTCGNQKQCALLSEMIFPMIEKVEQDSSKIKTFLRE